MGRSSIKSLLAEATRRLADAGVEAPGREARRLLGHALGLSQAGLLAERDGLVEAPAFFGLVARRAAREPLALILGRRGFWTLDLTVGPATLIPRPETETLIEAAIAQFADRRAVRRVLDLGTGTGCLLLAALGEFASAWGVGVDSTEAAVKLARGNAESLGLGGRAGFLCGDWGASLAARFDLVLCNPPYVRTADIPRLMPEVARYEPARALDGGADGLAAYRRLLPALPALLAPDGLAILELGAGQAEPVGALARGAGLDVAGLRHDLGDTARAILLRPGR